MSTVITSLMIIDLSSDHTHSLYLCVCVCVQVEVWLNRLLDTMRSTVRHEMTEAVTAYEEKPREQWLFDYPAQVNHGHHH